MADLRFDLDRLLRAHYALDFVSTRLVGMGEAYRRLPDAAGHDKLAGALGAFRDAWSVHREDLVTELNFLRDANKAIHDTFTELDQDLENRARQFLDPANLHTPGES
ncbi:hypothetical protein [Protaetiibacter larvae]|uniref:Uncharacterized protein n=1 Tax=Protaetiibacter larvae TaxID=2592654 RepID=A0A5C1YA01_9MICO|nr:hypothetical protein [Protaetiibacter larvae]QEO10646.1 hypothetical protein FLP23_11905 [Protaetiibacter larvae]